MRIIGAGKPHSTQNWQVYGEWNRETSTRLRNSVNRAERRKVSGTARSTCEEAPAGEGSRNWTALSEERVTSTFSIDRFDRFEEQISDVQVSRGLADWSGRLLLGRFMGGRT